LAKKNPNNNIIQSVDQIDTSINSPTRLKILIVLTAVVKADFTFLARTTGLTRGNLSVNLRKLEEEGYVHIDKTFAGRVPRTLIELTGEGRAALKAHQENMQTILDALLENLE
jgi:DNA-binding MarR family transcriptional regulator